MPYLLSNKAVEDLSEIYRYSFINFGEKLADQYADKILFAINKIVKNPFIGKDSSVLAKGLRCFRLAQHNIYYCSYLNKSILIVRILHVSMDHHDKLGKSI